MNQNSNLWTQIKVEHSTRVGHDITAKNSCSVPVRDNDWFNEKKKNVPMLILTSSRSDGNVQHALSKKKARATIDFSNKSIEWAVEPKIKM